MCGRTENPRFNDPRRWGGTVKRPLDQRCPPQRPSRHAAAAQSGPAAAAGVFSIDPGLDSPASMITQISGGIAWGLVSFGPVAELVDARCVPTLGPNVLSQPASRARRQPAHPPKGVRQSHEHRRAGSSPAGTIHALAACGKRGAAIPAWSSLANSLRPYTEETHVQIVSPDTGALSPGKTSGSNPDQCIAPEAAAVSPPTGAVAAFTTSQPGADPPLRIQSQDSTPFRSHGSAPGESKSPPLWCAATIPSCAARRFSASSFDGLPAFGCGAGAGRLYRRDAA